MSCMKPNILFRVALAGALVVPTLRAEETNRWTFDISLYGLAPSMSGNAVVKGVPADVDVGFDKIWDNLNFAAMGTVRVGYGPWALSTDAIYMDLEGAKGSFDVTLQQLMVLPALEYRLHRQIILFAGAQYDNLSLDVTRPRGRNSSGTQDWWDPIVGTQLTLPLGKHLSLNVRGDIGGFGFASDLTWQAFPYVDWQFSRWGSVQLGYRWIFADYETGSGHDRFKYDVLNQGPEIGVTVTF
jgi:hypothetical protein